MIQPELVRRYGLWGTREVTKRFPAYDLGHLLRRLPTHMHVFQGTTGGAVYLDKDGQFYGVGSCDTTLKTQPRS